MKNSTSAPAIVPIRLIALGMALGNPAFARDLSDRCGTWAFGRDSFEADLFLCIEGMLSDAPLAASELARQLGLDLAVGHSLERVVLEHLEGETNLRFSAHKEGNKADEIVLDIIERIGELARLARRQHTKQG